MKRITLVVGILSLIAASICGAVFIPFLFPLEHLDECIEFILWLFFFTSPILSSATLLRSGGTSKKKVAIALIASIAIPALVMAFLVDYHQTCLAEESAQEEVYIPQNLDACFAELDKTLSSEAVQEIKDCQEDDLSQFHFGLGMGLRNSWGLWAGSDLAKWFNEQGIHHPDDMSGIIIKQYWRHLNGHPIMLEEQISYYKKYWEDQKKEANHQPLSPSE